MREVTYYYANTKTEDGKYIVYKTQRDYLDFTAEYSDKITRGSFNENSIPNDFDTNYKVIDLGNDYVQKGKEVLDVQIRNLNIELDAQYDTDNNFDWRENLAKIDDSMDSVYQFIDNGNISVVDNAQDLWTIKSSNRKDKLLKVYEYFGGWQLDETSTKDEIIEGIYDLGISELYVASWATSRYSKLEDMLDVTTKFEVVESRGYSQGDYIDVIIPHSLHKIWGCTKKEFLEQIDDLSKLISHYAWDSPIVGSLKLSFNYSHNCVEYKVELEFDNIQEVLDDPYEMEINSNLVIKEVKAQMHIPLREDDEKELRKQLESFDYQNVSHPCYC